MRSPLLSPVLWDWAGFVLKWPGARTGWSHPHPAWVPHRPLLHLWPGHQERLTPPPPHLIVQPGPFLPCQLQDDTSSPGLAHCWVPPPRVLGSQVLPAFGKGRGAGMSWQGYPVGPALCGELGGSSGPFFLSVPSRSKCLSGNLRTSK